MTRKSAYDDNRIVTRTSVVSLTHPPLLESSYSTSKRRTVKEKIRITKMVPSTKSGDNNSGILVEKIEKYLLDKRS